MEQLRHPELSRKQLEQKLRDRGTDLEMLLYLHNLHKDFERRIVQSFEDVGCEVKLSSRCVLVPESWPRYYDYDSSISNVCLLFPSPLCVRVCVASLWLCLWYVVVVLVIVSVTIQPILITSNPTIRTMCPCRC